MSTVGLDGVGVSYNARAAGEFAFQVTTPNSASLGKIIAQYCGSTVTEGKSEIFFVFGKAHSRRVSDANFANRVAVDAILFMSPSARRSAPPVSILLQLGKQNEGVLFVLRTLLSSCAT